MCDLHLNGELNLIESIRGSSRIAGACQWKGHISKIGQYTNTRRCTKSVVEEDSMTSVQSASRITKRRVEAVDVPICPVVSDAMNGHFG